MQRLDRPTVIASALRIALTGLAFYALLFGLYDATQIPIGQHMALNPSSSVVYTRHHNIEAWARCLLAALGLLTLWRAKGPSAIALSIALICSSLDVYWQWYEYNGPLLWIAMVTKYLGTALGLAAFLYFAACFGDGDLWGIRRSVRKWAWLVLLIGLAGFTAQFLKLPAQANDQVVGPNVIAHFDPRFNPAGIDVTPLFNTYLIGYALIKLAMPALAFIGWVRSKYLLEQQRMVIVWTGFVLYALPTAVHFIVRALSGADPAWLNYGDAAGFVALGLALTFAIFWGQVFDVEYFLDRALAATLAGGILLVLYFSADHFLGARTAGLLSGWLTTGRSDSVMLQPPAIKGFLEVAFALLFFLLFHKVYTSFEKLIERIFSPDREQRLATLQDFQARIALLESVYDLQLQLRDAIKRGTNARFVSIFTREADRAYHPLDAAQEVASTPVPGDDEAVSCMQGGRAVHLTDIVSAIPGSLALPMPLAGQLYGFVACGPTPTEKRYAPDEVKALSAIAREAGAAIFALRMHRELVG